MEGQGAPADASPAAVDRAASEINGGMKLFVNHMQCYTIKPTSVHQLAISSI